jgi:hypothetical protein
MLKLLHRLLSHWEEAEKDLHRQGYVVVYGGAMLFVMRDETASPAGRQKTDSPLPSATMAAFGA